MSQFGATAIADIHPQSQATVSGDSQDVEIADLEAHRADRIHLSPETDDFALMESQEFEATDRTGHLDDDASPFDSHRQDFGRHLKAQPSGAVGRALAPLAGLMVPQLRRRLAVRSVHRPKWQQRRGDQELVPVARTIELERDRTERRSARAQASTDIEPRRPRIRPKQELRPIRVVGPSGMIQQFLKHAAAAILLVAQQLRVQILIATEDVVG